MPDTSVKLPPGYTLEEDVKVPPGYQLEGGTPTTWVADDPLNVYLYSDPKGVPVYGRPPGVATPKPLELQTDAEQRANAPMWRNPRTGTLSPMLPPGREGTPLGWLLDAPLVGIPQMGQGAERIANAQSLRDVAGGGSQIIRGGMQAMTPLLPGAFAAAPTATALTLGSGMAAGEGTEGFLKVLGVPAEYSALAGDLAGLFGGKKTADALGSLSRLREGDVIAAKLKELTAQAKDSNLPEPERRTAQMQAQILLEQLVRLPFAPAHQFLPQLSPTDLVPRIPGFGSSLNPVEQRAVNFLREQGVPMRAGVQTGNRYLQSAEAVTAASPLGAPEAAKFREKTEQGLHRVGRSLMSEAYPEATTPVTAGEDVRRALQQKSDAIASGLEEEGSALARRVYPQPVSPEIAGADLRSSVQREAAQTEAGIRAQGREAASGVHPEAQTPESAGQAQRDALDARIEEFRGEADKGYEKAWAGRDNPAFTQTVPLRTLTDGTVEEGRVNMPVDVTDIKARAESVREELQWALSRTEQSQSKAFGAIEKLLSGPDHIPAWAAERALSALKSLSRTTNKTGVRDYGQGVAAGLVPKLQERIDAAVARTGEEAIRGLQEGREAHANMMDVVDVAEKLREEPVQAYRQSIWPGDSNINFLRRMNFDAPDAMSKVARAFVDELVAETEQPGGWNRALTKWLDLGPETKRILYQDPKVTQKITAFLEEGKKHADTHVANRLANEPVKAYEQMVRPEDSGVDLSRRIANAAPGEVRKVARAFFDEVRSGVTSSADWKKAYRQWKSLGDSTREMLYGDREVRADIDAFFERGLEFGDTDIMREVADNPKLVYDRLTAAEDSRIDFVRKVQEIAPEQLPKVGRAFIYELMDKLTREGGLQRTKEILNAWRDLGPQTKELLYPDAALRGKLDNLFKGVDLVIDRTNPSGTEVTRQATSMNPVRWLAGLVGGKVLFTERGIDLLTQGLRVPENSSRGRMIRRELQGMGGQEPPEQGPPAGGGGQPGGQPGEGFVNKAKEAFNKARELGKQVWEDEEGSLKLGEWRRRKPQDPIAAVGLKYLMENPLEVAAKGESGQVKTVDVGREIRQAARSGGGSLAPTSDPEVRGARAAAAMAEDLKYALASQPEAREWYTGSVRDMEKTLIANRPEFKDAAKRGLMKFVLGVTSNGVDPDVNFDAAMRGWDLYQQHGKLMAYDPGRKSELSNSGEVGLTFRANSYQTAMGILNRLVQEKGEAGAVDWLKTKHSIAELKQYDPKITVGDGSDRYGAYVLGEKVGSFGLNLNGIYTELTADKWWSRTWNRWMGTTIATDKEGKFKYKDDEPLMQDDPRNETERNLMRQTATKVADELGLTVAELQAVLWYAEQALYRAHGIQAGSAAYDTAAKKFFSKRSSSAAGSGLPSAPSQPSSGTRRGTSQ